MERILKHMKQIALMGHGVVGSGVMEIFMKNANVLFQKAGEEFGVKYVLDVRAFPDLPYADKFVKDFTLIANDPEISVVVETIGGLDPAYGFVKTCLQKGKSVVSSNKELVATKGAELLAIAHQKNVNFLFEASVGGGIPIIRPLHQCLAANEITEIVGILNGTTNFILTKMFKEGMAFEPALNLAQELGYAERDPSADIKGADAARKICILASIAFGRHVYPKDVPTSGIESVSLRDVQFAGKCGSVIKLIGRAKKCGDGKIAACVSTALIPLGSQLASVDDVFNAILVRGDATGDVVFYGKGAGKLPTGSAVMADVISCLKETGSIVTLNWQDSPESVCLPAGEICEKRYIRVLTKNAEKITAACESLAVSCKIVEDAGECAVLTDEITAEKLSRLVEALEKADLTVASSMSVLEY